MIPHLFGLKQTKFVLWRPANTAVPPRLVIGEFKAGNPPTLENGQGFAMALLPSTTDLWGIDAAACGLTDGHVYHYWFEVTDSSPDRDGRRILCTDPAAFTVDWRLQADPLPAPYNDDDRDPAAVVLFRNGELIPCDADGDRARPGAVARTGEGATKQSPRDLRAADQLDEHRTCRATRKSASARSGTCGRWWTRRRPAANFAGIPALSPGRSHLEELGINALELLPIADSFVEREWGYATSNYFAPDYDLGFPKGNASPTASGDLVEPRDGLSRARHPILHRRRHGLRDARADGERELRRVPHRPASASPNDPDAAAVRRAGHARRVRRHGCGATDGRTGFDPLSGASRQPRPGAAVHEGPHRSGG